MELYNMGGPTSYNGKIQAVHGLQGAKNILIQPGSSVILPDDSEKIMWLIEANGFGVKTVTGYTYDGPTEQSKPEEKSADEPVYVTTKEFDELKGKLNKLIEQLGGDK